MNKNQKHYGAKVALSEFGIIFFTNDIIQLDVGTFFPLDEKICIEKIQHTIFVCVLKSIIYGIKLLKI